MKIVAQKKGIKADLVIYFVNNKILKKLQENTDLTSQFKIHKFNAQKNEFCIIQNKIYFGVERLKSKNDWRILGHKIGLEIAKLNANNIIFNKDLPVKSQEFFEGLLLSEYIFNRYKTKKKKVQKKTLYLRNFNDLQDSLKKAQIIIGAQNTTRDIVNTGEAEMNQQDVAAQVLKNFKDIPEVKVEIYDEKKLKQLNMNGMLAVNQASRNEAVLIKMTYEPKNYKEHIVLVGKGVVYDSGGLSLKPSESMETMHYDKAGSITVMGIMKATAQIGSKKKITVYMAMVENVTGSNSYKVGAKVTMKNGKIVNIGNTDAEGRIVLADGLALAEQENSNIDSILTFATLTGASVRALGPQTAALIGYNKELKNELISSGKKTGELFYYLPFNEYMMDSMNHHHSDLNNISNIETQGAQTAGLFLTNFLTKKVRKKYLHVDMAGPGYANKPWGVYHTIGATGACIRSMVHLLTK